MTTSGSVFVTLVGGLARQQSGALNPEARATLVATASGGQEGHMRMATCACAAGACIIWPASRLQARSRRLHYWASSPLAGQKQALALLGQQPACRRLHYWASSPLAGQ